MSGRDDTAVSSVFYAPPGKHSGDTLFLPPDEAHHALRVRRIHPNEELVVVDGEGGWFRAVQAGNGAAPCPPGHLPLRILVERREVGESHWRLTLAQAVAKGKAFDTLVEKATELGVAAILPLITERVVARRDPGESAGRRERWQRIALAAMKQCGRSRLPGILEPIRLADLAGRFREYDAVVCASCLETSRTVEEAIRRSGEERDIPTSILALVGPEGGFTAQEEELAVAAGAIPITLGPRTLRTETAGAVIAALVAAALQARVCGPVSR